MKNIEQQIESVNLIQAEAEIQIKELIEKGETFESSLKDKNYEQIALFFIANEKSHFVRNKIEFSLISYALENGMSDVAANLAKSGMVDINEKEATGQNSIISAIANDDLVVLKALIEAGVDLDFETDRGDNILHYIAYYDNKNKMTDLIADKIDLLKFSKVKNKEDDTPMDIAGNKNPIFKQKVLGTYNKKENCNEEFIIAINDFDTNSIKETLQLGADITFKGNYAIKWSARNGRLDIIKLIIEYGVDITADNNWAIQSASKRGHIDVVKLLIKNGSDISSRVNYCVRYAAANGHLEVVNLLIEYGADITANDNFAIRHAAKNNHTEMVNLLIENDADTTVNNNEIIHAAFKNNNIEMVKVFVGHNIQIDPMFVYFAAQDKLYDLVKIAIPHIDIKNYDTFVLIKTLAAYGQLELIKLIVEQGADIADNDNILYAAVSNEHLDVVKYLISQGADVTTEYNKAIFDAVEKDNNKLLKVLLEDVVKNHKKEIPILLADLPSNAGFMLKNELQDLS